MATAIHHRGPDSDGRIDATNAAVAFKRLSIIDLETGDQPVSNADGSIQVFLNGEIFNHHELRRGLVERGHRLRTQSDAEVIPYLYEEMGLDFLHELNGMFTICIVDHRRAKVVLARDRAGIKPLYYAETADAVVFGSELKAVLASDLLPRRIDRAQVASFLTWFYSPGRRTLAEGVQKLQPGELLELDARGGCEPKRWYRIPLDAAATGPQDVEDLLRDAVRLQLVADVPLGISLSGGLDSSLLAQLAADSGPTDLKLFTIHFEGTPRDEVECASAVAEHLGGEHVVLSATNDDFLDQAPAAIWSCDEPVSDPAFYSALKVSQAAAQIVTVLLSGTGGDELFAGYGHYPLSWKKRLYVNAPSWLRRQGFVVSALGRSDRPDELESLDRYADTRLPWHLAAMASLDRRSQAELVAAIEGSGDPDSAYTAAFEEGRSLGPLDQQLYADTVTYLPDQLLPVLDRATMAASIEGRVPYLDHRVVEAAFALPPEWKLGPRGVGKRALREMSGRLPPEVLSRKKFGFPNAVLQWLDGGLGELLPRILRRPDSLARELLPASWLDPLIASDAAMRANWRVLYSLLVLEVWHELVIRRGDFEPPQMSLAALFDAAD